MTSVTGLKYKKTRYFYLLINYLQYFVLTFIGLWKSFLQKPAMSWMLRKATGLQPFILQQSMTTAK